MILTAAEGIALAAAVWGLLSAVLTLALKESYRDASLYPFIAAVTCFFIAVPPGSYISGALFIASLVLGILLYRDY
jgi:predicted membrane channel-forming protein YqfA (hemolysin III family)